MRQRFVLLEIVAACAALAACGGGGGEPVSAEATAASTAAAAPSSDAGAASSSADLAAASDPVGGGDMLFASQAAEAAQPGTATDTTTADTGPTETAQTLTLDSNDAGYAKPRVAALDYSSNSTSTRQALLAKFPYVIWGARVGSTAAAFSAGIHSRNSSTKQAFYVQFTELACSATSTQYTYPMVQLANKANFWLRKADGSRSQWTSMWDTCDMNISAWGRKDSSGWTWLQRKAQFDYNTAFKNLPYVTYAFTDNNFGLPRVNADWKRIGTNQLRTDSTIIAAQRDGQAAYWSALKGFKNLNIVANADNDLSAWQYKGKLQGAFFEGAMGRSWSIETWGSWSKMMQRYRAQLANTISPHAVFFQVYGSTTDYRMMRYGLASALLDNGYFVYLPSSGTLQPTWYDEYDARIGTPVDGPQTSPKQNGIYMRRYTNGLVLVNPSKTTTASIYVGSGYKRLKGTQDPYVNNGHLQSTVTLGPRQGLLMIRN